jgi:6-phosphogluconate dehydrogenase
VVPQVLQTRFAPTSLMTAALVSRLGSRGEAEFQSRMLSAMRFRFGGDLEKK